MQRACEMIEELFKLSGRNDKTTMLVSSKEDPQLAKEIKFLFETALDPYLHYGIHDFDDTKDYRNDIPTLKELESLREKLVNREVTGNAARDLIKRTVLCSDFKTRKWLVAVFTKLLRCGVAEGTVNKVFPGLIREFQIQLCDKLQPDQELDGGDWIIEPKFDGLRCLMIFQDNELIEVCSRNGRPLYNMEHIGKELAPYIKNGVLDGEAYGSDWNDSAGVVRSSKTERTSEDLRFYAFDLIPIEEWTAREGRLTLKERKEVLKAVVPVGLKYTVLTQFKAVKNASEAWYWAKQFNTEGFEGAVAKRLDSKYEYERTRMWLKLKFEESIDVPIIAYEVGTGRNADRLGAFICRLPNGETVNVGGGYKDHERTKFWVERDKMIGKVIECKFQSETKDGASLRFPIFVRVREDK